MVSADRKVQTNDTTTAITRKKNEAKYVSQRWYAGIDLFKREIGRWQERQRVSENEIKNQHHHRVGIINSMESW